MKKFWNKEVKIGLLVVVCGFILFFGLNYLKGFNIFNPSNCYYARYANLDGLIVSSPVYIQGYKVGQVSEINYDFSKTTPFIVTMDIDADIRLPKGTIAKLDDDGLLSGKCISLEFEKWQKDMIPQGDTLMVTIAPNMADTLVQVLYPRIQRAIEDADSLMASLHKLTKSSEMKHTMASMEGTMKHLEKTSAQLESVMQTDVPKTLASVRGASDELTKVGQNLNELALDSTVNNVNGTMGDLRDVVEKMNSKEGTLGLLINDSTLYHNYNQTGKNANELLIDLKENPKKYVHFSVFGKNKTN